MLNCVPELVTEIVPVRGVVLPVTEIVPVRVTEMVPALVTEMVPVLVTEIVPVLANVVAERLITNNAAQATDL